MVPAMKADCFQTRVGTNVYKLYRATRNGPDTSIDPRAQIAFYLHGIGTPAPGEKPHNIRQTFERCSVTA